MVSKRAQNRQQRNILRSHQSATSSKSSLTSPLSLQELQSLSPELQNLSQEDYEKMTSLEIQEIASILSHPGAVTMPFQSQNQNPAQNQTQKRNTGSTASATPSEDTVKPVLSGKYKALADEYEVTFASFGALLNFGGAMAGKPAIGKDGDALIIHAHNVGTHLGLLAKKYKPVYEALVKVTDISAIMGFALSLGMLGSTLASNHGFKTPAFDNPDMLQSLAEQMVGSNGSNTGSVSSVAA